MGAELARLTPAAAGPYRIDGNRILDSKDRPYLVRGTELPTLTLSPADMGACETPCAGSMPRGGGCHRQELAFTDGRAHAVGTTGQTLPRGSMTLVNVAYAGALTWSNPNIHTLEELALAAMFAANPLELGVDKQHLLRLIRHDPIYRPLFPRAFPGEANPYRIANVANAIASFVRTIVSRGSPYDRFHFDGDAEAIPESAKRGEILFFLDYGGPSCFRCHGGFNLSDAVEYGRGPAPPVKYHNNGATRDAGLFAHTKDPADAGKFKAPTLRNIALTAPYMHDGSVATLGEVVDHYAAGGRMGHDNPSKDPLVHGFFMTPQNRADLIAFLESLTDEDVIHDPKFADPWTMLDRPGGLSYKEFK